MAGAGCEHDHDRPIQYASHQQFHPGPAAVGPGVVPPDGGSARRFVRRAGARTRLRRTQMSGTSIPLGDDGGVTRSGANTTYVIVAAVIALVALGFAAALVKSVLSTDKGTEKMQEIAGAVQEGATAYLLRQFRTLGIFVVIAVVLLFVLPIHGTSDNETAVKIGRSVFFVIG